MQHVLQKPWQTPISIAFVLLSAFFHALWNYYGKASRSPQLFFFWIGVFYSECMAILAFALQLPIAPKSVWGYIAGIGCCPLFLLGVLEPRLYVW